MNRQGSGWMAVMVAAVLLLGCTPDGGGETEDAESLPKVTSVDDASMPDFVQFRIDQALASCETGSDLRYLPGGSGEAERNANARAALKLLQTALDEELAVKLEGATAVAGETFCTVSAVELRR